MNADDRPILARLSDGTRMTPNGYFLGAVAAAVLSVTGLVIRRERILSRRRTDADRFFAREGR